MNDLSRLNADSTTEVEQGAEKTDTEQLEEATDTAQLETQHDIQVNESVPSIPILETEEPYNCARVVGARLTQLRQDKNWLLDDVSAQLKVPVSKLRALEAGDVSVLPDAAFTLGLVRAYSKILGIDPTPFIEELRSANGPLKEALVSLGMHRELLSKHVLNTPGLVRSRWAALKHRRGGVVALVGLGVVCLAIVGLLLFSHHEAAKNDAAAEQIGASAATQGLPTPAELGAPPAAPAAQNSVPAAQSHEQTPASAPISKATHSVSAAAVVSTTPATALKASNAAGVVAPATSWPALRQSAPLASTQSAAPDTISNVAGPVATKPLVMAASTAPNSVVAPVHIAPGAVQQGSSAIIHFRVSQDNWISVSQADGKLLYAGLLKAGSEHNVQGVAPFKVTAGSKTGLDAVTLDGRPVDLSKYLATKQDVVRFNLR